MIAPGGLLLVVPAPVCCLSLSFIGGIAKEYITKLGCESYFCGGHILSTAGDALSVLLTMTDWELLQVALIFMARIMCHGQQFLSKKTWILQSPELFSEGLYTYKYIQEFCRIFKRISTHSSKMAIRLEFGQR
jgi:hypothetical protein